MPIYNAPLKKVDHAETRRYAGLNKAKFDEEIIESACRDVQILAQPKGIWNLYDYDASNALVHADPPFLIEGKKIQKHLAASTKVVLLAATIGEAVEEEITACFKGGKYSYSLLLDAAATTAVEQAADELEKTIRQKIEPMGYDMVWRFSPGYGDWDIRFQPEMIRLSQANQIGISLTESMMLLPRKSITAIIGLVAKQEIFACEHKSVEKHDCQICEKTDCLARKS